MEFHWDPKPADPVVNQRCCNRRGFLVPYGISFGPFAEVIADDHYVLIPVLGHRERTCYVHCNSFERRTDVVLLHRPSRSSPRSLDRRTGRTSLAPALNIFSTMDPVKSLPNFSKRFVDSKMSTRTIIVHFSKYFLGSNRRNNQLHGDMFPSPHYCGAYQPCVEF